VEEQMKKWPKEENRLTFPWALILGIFTQVATILLAIITIPFLGYLPLLLSPGLLFIPENPDSPYADKKGLILIAGLVLDTLLYSFIISFLSWFIRRRNKRMTLPSILR
jgi:uncharacterized membrane protein YphA (DoxX/SURF4 family)